MKQLALLFLFIAMSACSTKQATPPLPKEPAIAAETILADVFPRPVVELGSGVKLHSSLTYSTPMGHRPLALDLYLPPGNKPDKGFPVVVYIHGGAWMGGDRHRSGAFVNFPQVLASLAARGYVVASLSYRLSGEAKFPAQIQDVKTAIRWLRQNAGTYGINKDMFLSWGVSAGGHLATLAAVTCGEKALAPVTFPHTPIPDSPTGDPLIHESDCVQGGASWYGIYNFASITTQAKKAKAASRETPDAPEWQLLGCFASSCGHWPKRASPISYVDSEDPPLLLITGDEDKTVPYQQTLEMVEKINAANIRLEHMVIPGVDHGLIGKDYEQTKAANLEALARTFQFFDSIAGKTAPTLQTP